MWQAINDEVFVTGTFVPLRFALTDNNITTENARESEIKTVGKKNKHIGKKSAATKPKCRFSHFVENFMRRTLNFIVCFCVRLISTDKREKKKQTY